MNLKEIKEEKLPPLDDEFAKELKFDSLEAATKYARERLKEAKENIQAGNFSKSLQELQKKVVNTGFHW